MTFKKVFIKKSTTSETYFLSLEPKKDYDVYFTDADGYQKVVNSVFLEKELKFNELPKPLLKQIR